MEINFKLKPFFQTLIIIVSLNLLLLFFIGDNLFNSWLNMFLFIIINQIYIIIIIMIIYFYKKIKELEINISELKQIISILKKNK